MPTSEHSRDIDFGGPAVYRIVVQGALEERWSDRFAGMAITTIDRKSGAPRTVLTGSIRDQAELSERVMPLVSP